MSQPDGNNASGARAAAWVISLSAAVLLPLALLYFSRYQEQREISAQRYERSIQTFARQVNEVVENALEGFDRTSNRASLDQILEAPSTPSSSSAFWVQQLSVGNDDKVEPPKCPLRLSPLGKLTFHATGSSQNAQGAFENWDMHLASDLERQLSSYAKGFTSGHPFDALLVTDQDGNMFLFKGSDEGRPARSQIRSLFPEGSSIKSSPDKERAVKEIVNEPLTLAGRSYLVFHREIQSYSSEAAQKLMDENKDCQAELSFHAIGLVRADAPRQAGLQLTSEPVVALLLLAVFGLLSFPFLKLFLLPVGERFRRADALLLLACGALLFTVLTYLSLVATSHASLRESEDADLRDIAGLLRVHFVQESQEAFLQLEALLNPSWAAEKSKGQIGVLYADLDHVLCPAPPPIPDPPMPMPVDHQIRWRWNEDNILSPSMELIEQASTEDSDLEGLNRSKPCYPAAFGPQQFWPTGERITRFEGRGPTQKDCATRTEAHVPIPPRCVLFARTRSLEQALLPEHFGFAVLDERGEVLYHSDPWRAGFESFPDEIEGSVWPVQGVTTLSYQGAERRVLVTPFRRNWYLAVFHDQEAFGATRLYTGLFVLVLSMVYVLVLAALSSLLLLLFPTLRVPCYWRRTDEGDLYRRMAILFAVIGSIAVWQISNLPPWAAVLVGGLVATEAFLLTLLALARRTRSMDRCSPPARSVPRPHPVLWILAAIAVAVLLRAIAALGALGSAEFWQAVGLLLLTPLALAVVVRSARRSASPSGTGQAGFSLALTLLFLLVGGLPGYAFYRAAFQEESRAHALRGQSQMLVALAQRRRAAEDQQRSEMKYVTAPSAESASSLAEERSFVFPISLKGTKIQVSPSAPWFDRLYAGFRDQAAPKPWSDYTDKTSRALRSPGSGGTEGFQVTCQSDQQSEVTCSQASDRLPRIVLRSELPALFPPSQRRFALAIGLIGLILAWALIDRAAAWLIVTAVTGEREDLDLLTKARILWLAPPGSWQELVEEKPGKRVIWLFDLLQLTEASDTEVFRGQTVVVRRFGRDPGNVELNRRRIAALRVLMSAEPLGIWLLSEVSPLELARPSEEKSEALADLLEEWFVIRHPRSAAEIVKRLAQSNPETIWRSLTSEERRVGQQVAAGGLLRLGDAGRALIEYGVLEANPQPHICDPSLERFLSHRAMVEKSAPAPTGTNLWSTTRTVLLMSLAVVLGFLLLTQAEAFQLLSGAITSLAVVLAAVSQLGHLLRPSPSSNGS